MRQFQIAKLEYNEWNGFTFNLLRIETRIPFTQRTFEGSLFGISAWNFLIIDLLFIQFEIKSPIL